MTSIQKLRAALWGAVIILLVGGLVAYLQKSHLESYTDQINKDDSAIAPAFSLIDMQGNPVTEQSWPDQYKLIYFGYSNCPDICPTGLQTVSEALDKLPKTTAAKIQPLLISIDPDRDTPEALKIYTAQFHSKILGLTGSKEQIDAASKTFKIYAARVPEPEGVTPSQQDYLMDHSNVIYLLDKNSNFVKAFSSDELTSDALVKELQKIIH